MIVAPLVGAWIEIKILFALFQFNNVAPLVGAWIEIKSREYCWKGIGVAPLVGAWIEISSFCLENNQPVSLPSWERGLKSVCKLSICPFIGRSPRGSVD